MNDKYISGSVSIDKNPEIINNLKRAKEAAILHDWGMLAGLTENILLMDVDCSDVRYMKALLSLTGTAQFYGSNFSIIPNSGSFDHHVGMGDSAINKYGIFSKEDISHCWGKYTITVRLKVSGKALSNIPYISIKLDGKEEINLSKDRAGGFGVSEGTHSLSFQMFDSKTKTFTVSGDMDIEVELSLSSFGFHSDINVLSSLPPQTTADAAPGETPAKKGWWGRR